MPVYPRKRLAVIALSCALLAACTSLASSPNAVEIAVAPAGTSSSGFTFSAERLKADIAFLADDLLEGREAGTRGYDLSALYVANQMRAAGLAPVSATEGYFQNVPLRVTRFEDGGVTFTHTSGESLDLADQAYVVPSPVEDSVGLYGEIAFAGYGLIIPEQDRDDFAGLDLTGKIVAVFSGAPEGLQSEEAAFYGSTANKARAAADRGAVGLMTLYTPERSKRFGFERARFATQRSARMSWLEEDGTPFSAAPGIEAYGVVSIDGARTLLSTAGQDYDDLQARAHAGETVAGFDLPVTASFTISSTLEDLKSANVIGLIEGSDPALKHEVVILTAHLDHIGANGPEKNGDLINNGALDNAAGTAALLEAARAAMAGPRPRRTLMFAAVTAEEKGLVGSDYLARNVPAGYTLVANINLDMPILTYSFTDVVAFGAERSDLEGPAREAAQTMGVDLSPDPMPDQALFTRSDHYRFVQQGVPSMFLVTGYANGGEAAWGLHFANRYHQPTDDLTNAIRYEDAARFARLNYEIMTRVANADGRPFWKPGDFFAMRYGGLMPEIE